MAKFIVLYQEPKDKEGFEKYYNKVHMPIVREIPNIKNISLNYVMNVQNTSENYYLLVEVEFENMEILHTSLSSEAGKKAQEDAKNIAPFLKTQPIIMFTE